MDVTEEMAPEIMRGMLRRWRRQTRGEWRWVLLATFSIVLLTILLRAVEVREHEVRVQYLEVEIGRGEARSHFSRNSSLQLLPVKEASSVSILRHYERQVMDSYMRVQFALAESSGSVITPSGPPLLDVGTLSDLRSFKPLLTAREKARLLYTFEVFSTACQLSGLKYFLLDNSLIGSVRHHGTVPWADVSISVGMRKEDQNRALHVLDSLSGMTLFWPSQYAWTLRVRDSKPDPPDLVRMTFVHIHFYCENSTHIWGESWGGERTFTALRERVFPLMMRPFEGWLVPSPCDFTAVVNETEVKLCRVKAEDLLELEWMDAGFVPCDVLKQVFPFVTRHVSDGKSHMNTEQAYVNGTLLYSVDVQAGCAGRLGT